MRDEDASVAQERDFALDNSVSMGVDLVEVERIRAILKRSPSFARRAFSDDERAYCDASSSPEFHYATRFAAKEAVLKALGTGFSEGIGVRDIEVVLNAKGKPRVCLHRRAADVAHEKGVREIPLSLSYTHSDAVACALVITDEVVEATKKRIDPTEELTRQFKQARALLDELDAPRKDSFADDVQPDLFGQHHRGEGAE